MHAISMFRNSFLVALFLATLASCNPLRKRTNCSSVYVIYARGTDPINGISSTVPDTDPYDAELEQIANEGMPGAPVVALPYPASGIVSGTDYFTSWGVGIDKLQAMIEYCVDLCPQSKIVLLGYSQGASVITGSLMGGQGRAPLAQKFLRAIAGGVAFADPSYVPGLSPLDNGSTNLAAYGTFQDGDVQTNLNDALGGVFRSYCATGDEWCASGGQAGAGIHDNEEATWSATAIDFLQSLEL